MSNFDLQGESNLLSDKQLKFVCEVLEKHGFKGSKVIIDTLGKAGDNYSSNAKTITAEREDGKTLKMIAKVAPATEFLRAAMNIKLVFGNEFSMYDKILPTFRQLEIEANVPEEDRLKFPICYGTFNEELHEIILLEDLREIDYIMKDRIKSLTNDEILLILDTFAKLHSFSFALRKSNSATYMELISTLSDFFTSPQMEENVNTSFTLIEDNIYSLFSDNKYKNKIKGSLSNIVNEAHKLRKCDAKSKYSVITHGDSWTNNILFKLNDITGISEECMLIDYQLSIESCPVSDLLYLIFSCTDYDTRSKYYEDWIDEYHKKLDKYLSYYGINANFVYTKEKMLADLKRYSKFFLGWSIVMANVLCIDTEEAARFKNAMDSTCNVDEIMEAMKIESTNTNSQMLLKTKVQGIIDSYYDLGYCS